MPIETVCSNFTVTDEYKFKVSKSGSDISFSEILQQASQANIEKTSKGYAYVDKYGFSHVVEAYETAVKYVKPDTEIYGYHGKFEGGYAKDNDNNRMPLPLPQSVPYGNDEKRQSKVEHIEITGQTAEEIESKVPNINDYLEEYPGTLSLLPSYYQNIDFNIIDELESLSENEE